MRFSPPLQWLGHCNHSKFIRTTQNPLISLRSITYTRRTFTPDTSGDYVFSTCNEVLWDSRIAILSTCGDPASLLTCNDDCADSVYYSSETPAVTLVGGTKYYIAIGGFDATVVVGAGTLTIAEVTQNGMLGTTWYHSVSHHNLLLLILFLLVLSPHCHDTNRCRPGRSGRPATPPTTSPSSLGLA